MEKEENLPSNIAIFPLSNAIFFPGTILPLNIFENRYLQLVGDCMKEKRMFGMVQPKNRLTENPEVYKVGCLGKIVSFKETEDGRYIIELKGLIRFKIVNEINNKAIEPIIILTPSSDIYEKVIEPISMPNNDGGIINLTILIFHFFQ